MSRPPDTHDPPRDRLKSWFADLVWRITPECREVARLTSEARDHSLPFSTRLRLSLHRLACEWCARYARQLDFLHEAGRKFPEQMDETTGPSLDRAAKARMRRALHQEPGDR
jgi:hypothetical protein